MSKMYTYAAVDDRIDLDINTALLAKFARQYEKRVPHAAAVPTLVAFAPSHRVASCPMPVGRSAVDRTPYLYRSVYRGHIEIVTQPRSHKA